MNNVCSCSISREMKKYVRRRYTDSRHPAGRDGGAGGGLEGGATARLEVPEGTSPQYPPIRKKGKTSASSSDLAKKDESSKKS